MGTCFVRVYINTSKVFLFQMKSPPQEESSIFKSVVAFESKTNGEIDYLGKTHSPNFVSSSDFPLRGLCFRSFGHRRTGAECGQPNLKCRPRLRDGCSR